MPADVYHETYEFLPRSKILHFEEIERLTRLFVELGVSKLRVTGGEPLLRTQLSSLIEKLARINGVKDIALTTNGLLLPKYASALADAGLSRVTVSLDTLNDATFRRLSGADIPVRAILDGIEAAERAKLSPIKLNCVVQRGVNDEELVELATFFKGSGHIVRFIEYMDVGTLNGWELSQVVPAREIIARIHAVSPLEPIDANYRGEVAKRWRHRDGGGEIGMIASVTEPFCSECARARLSSDGHLITCLFATGGLDLKTPMRQGISDQRLMELIASRWSTRDDRYSALRSKQTQNAIDPEKNHKLEMYHIGG